MSTHFLTALLCVVTRASEIASVDDSANGKTSEIATIDDSTNERTAALVNSQVSEPWNGETYRDLRAEYYNIFKHGNRNAASHLWSSFLLQRSQQMTPYRLEHMFTGFCAVSGSPVTPMDRTRYKMVLDRVDGKEVTGFTYYCCWPCVCDTQDFIRVDTLTVPTARGPTEYEFLVIGDPCLDPQAKIPYQAPEVICDPGSGLRGATYSDHGFVILTMFFPFDASVGHQDDVHFAKHCQRRADNGYQNGMGEIFRKVAGISKIVTRCELDQVCPAQIQLKSEYEKVSLPSPPVETGL